MSTIRKWKCSDGYEIAGDYFAAAPARARAVIAPAMGVPRGFYRHFASYLAANGVDAITFDYRVAPGTNMTDWGRLDIEAMISGSHDDLPLFLIGHSCGGQLAGLAPGACRLDGLVLVAAQSGYWRHWRGRGRAAMWLLGHIVIPTLAHGRYFPARRLGLFSVDVPATVIAQWGRWMRSPRYLFDNAHVLDTGAYRELAQPALVYGFDDDGYAPAAAIDALLQEYPKMAVTRRQLVRNDNDMPAIGHMGFFRKQMRDLLWKPTVDWILATASQRQNHEPPTSARLAGEPLFGNDRQQHPEAYP